MDISSQDAESCLNEVSQVQEHTKIHRELRGSEWASIIWGIAWVTGVLLQHYFSRNPLVLEVGRLQVIGSGMFWWPVVLVALLATWMVSTRAIAIRSEREREIDRAIGWTWLALYVFWGFWIFVPINAGISNSLVTIARCDPNAPVIHTTPASLERTGARKVVPPSFTRTIFPSAPSFRS